MQIAIIPARGGSKRIPRKNIRMFCGSPMIAWSIKSARASNLFERVLVSTDDPDIAEIAKSFGAEVPFIRANELSGDLVGTTEVIGDAVKWCLDQNWNVQGACCIYPTAPFVQPSDLQKSFQIFESREWEYVFSATEYASTIFRSFLALPSGGVKMLFPEKFGERSQDLPNALHDAAQFYWGKPGAWTEGKRLFDEHSHPFRVPRWRVQDIDTEEDWVRAELMANSILKLPQNK